ncbi:unnamed protein product [Paramecium pentaurelia]|uniref:Homologous-pairing protein 2 winged helix domain-containing protein n=1 Tax=Paramecium pentaurelia TaxID=43138 RepID=A0A8S1RZD4_9CILI|nr:unnamed protein product [Paramecium pentaurelia]
MSEETAQVKQKGKKGAKKKAESKTTQNSDPPIVTQVDDKKKAKPSKKVQQASPPKKKDEKKQPEKKGKQPLIKEDVDSLLEYFKSSNRPFTVNYLKDTLFLKLSTLQKNIDTLVSKGDVVMKEVGSTKVFLINQNLMPTVNQQDLELLGSELEQKTEEYKQLALQNSKLSEQLKNLSKIPTLQELMDMKTEMKQKIDELENKLLLYEDKNFKMATAEETLQVENEYQNMLNICKKRKNIYNEAIGSLLSESDLTIKQFEKIVGIFRD